MLRRGLIPVWVGVTVLSGMFLMGQDTWPPQTAPITIDFDDLLPNTPVTSQYIELGVEFSLVNSTLPGPFTYQFPIGVGEEIFGARGNGIHPGDSLLGPYFDIRILFTDDVDWFSILALDLEGTATVQLFKDNQIVLDSNTDELGVVLGFWDSEPRGPVRLIEVGAVGGPLRFNEVVIGNSAGGPEVMDRLIFNTISAPVP